MLLFELEEQGLLDRLEKFFAIIAAFAVNYPFVKSINSANFPQQQGA